MYVRLSYFGIKFLRFSVFHLHMHAVGINIYYIMNFIKTIISE